MGIHTYAHLKDEILNSGVYKELMKNYMMYRKGMDGFLNSIKGVLPKTVSWTAWFKANPEICEFLYSTAGFKRNPQDIIPYCLYKNLYDISKLKTKDPTALEFVYLVRSVLGKNAYEVLNAIEVYEEVLRNYPMDCSSCTLAGLNDMFNTLTLRSSALSKHDDVVGVTARVVNRLLHVFINNYSKEFSGKTVEETARNMKEWGDRVNGGTNILEYIAMWGNLKIHRRTTLKWAKFWVKSCQMAVWGT